MEEALPDRQPPAAYEVAAVKPAVEALAAERDGQALMAPAPLGKAHGVMHAARCRVCGIGQPPVQVLLRERSERAEVERVELGDEYQRAGHSFQQVLRHGVGREAGVVGKRVHEEV